MKNIYKILPAVLVLVAAGGGYWWYQSSRVNDKPVLSTVKVERGEISSSISSTGKLDAAVFVNVGSQISGTVEKLFVDFNSPVKAGQIIAQLDRETLEAAMRQARANVSSAKARLAQAKSQAALEETKISTDIAQRKASLNKAEADWQRLAELHGKGYISAQELDVAKETVAVARAQYEAALGSEINREVRESDIAAAKAAVEQTEAALHQAQANLDHTIIRSPIDGIVISRNVDEGQTVAASLQTPTLFVIGDLSKMKVNISVDEADIGQVKVGQDAEFTVDAFPERPFKGKVAEIYRAPTVVQNVVTYNTILVINNREGLLMPGMTANVSVITAKKEGVLLVPNSALRVKMPVISDKPQASSNGGGKPEGKGARGKAVWIMKGMAPERVPVTTGISDSNRTEILNGEVKEGDNVVVADGKAARGSSSPRSPLSFGGRH